MERLVIRISKSKAWMVQRTDGCVICEQIHSNNGLGLALVALTASWVLVRGNDNGMAQSLQRTSQKEKRQNRQGCPWAVAVWAEWQVSYA